MCHRCTRDSRPTGMASLCCTSDLTLRARRSQRVRGEKASLLSFLSAPLFHIRRNIDHFLSFFLRYLQFQFQNLPLTSSTRTKTNAFEDEQAFLVSMWTDIARRMSYADQKSVTPRAIFGLHMLSRSCLRALAARVAGGLIFVRDQRRWTSST